MRERPTPAGWGGGEEAGGSMERQRSQSCSSGFAGFQNSARVRGGLWGLELPPQRGRVLGLTLVVAFLLGSASSVDGKESQTVIVTQQNWVFLDKFVYDTSGSGALGFEVEIQADEADMIHDFSYVCTTTPGSTSGNISFQDCTRARRPSTYLLFYNDQDDSVYNFMDVYEQKDLSCDQKMRQAQQPFPLEAGMINKAQINVKPAARPRFWYVVIANCQATKLMANVKLSFYNDGWNQNPPKLTYQFGFDEQGLFEMSIFFFIMYSLGMFANLFIIRSFLRSGVMHEIHWMLFGSFSAYFCDHLLLMVYYTRYALYGMGEEWLPIFARCMEVFGFVVFINVLLFIARGWTITTNKLSRKAENALVSGVIVCIYIALFFSETLQDPATAGYLYDSWPGYLFAGMNIFLLLLFLSLLQRTYVFEKRIVKRTFYRRFGFLFILWWIQLPIFVLISRAIPPWYRSKVMQGLQWAVQMIAFFLIPALSKPKNSYEIYSAENNYDARIPSLARQQRVQPMALELPSAQVGGLPPVNRNMTNNLERAANLEAGGVGGGTGLAGVTHAARQGEGIIE